MAKRLVRKNLMVDADQLRELARRRGMSESATVRQLIDYALAADEAMEALRELRDRGGIDDVFEKVPKEDAG